MTIGLRRFWIKLRYWEYWPFGIIQAPLFIYWLWLSLKARSLFYFSASNPSILTGGMMGESKFDVLNLIPESYKPKSILIHLPASLMKVEQSMREVGINFPCVFKPDIGQRGWMVHIIYNQQEAEQYLSEIRISFIIQELVEAPLEYGVFYVRKPDDSRGRVVSLAGKQMLRVIGDGRKTISQLIHEQPRALLQSTRLKSQLSSEWNEILPMGEEKILNRIGNHCLGTCFLDHSHLITEKLNASFDRLSSKIDGFYFGRFDLRCDSENDLLSGNVKILELNGCGAEPAHIFQPGFSLITALGVLFRHMRDMYEVSAQNHKYGIPYLSFREAWEIYHRTITVMGK